MGFFKNIRNMANEMGDDMDANFAAEIAAGLANRGTPSSDEIRSATVTYFAARGANPPAATIDGIVARVKALLAL